MTKPFLSRPWTRLAAKGILGGLRVLMVLVLCFFISLEFVVSSTDYPSELFDHSTLDSTRIYDADGNMLREIVNEDGMRARWTPLKEISPWVQKATVAVEDKRFRSHEGVDWGGVLRAATSNAVEGRIVSGASTLTMQLARLIRPHERSFIGKLVETVDALRIERALSKDDILEQYLNRAPYGAGCVGVEAASHRYFGKPTALLSVAEAALIAGLPNSPNRLNPFRSPENARKRQLRVLSKMHRVGYIDETQLVQARTEKLALLDTQTSPVAMHFTEWVLESSPRGDVHTSLDGAFQREVESHVTSHLGEIAHHGATHAAVVVLDNTTCTVKALVGSRDYWRDEGGAVNGALALRQPGSTLKPFTYALAFEQGASPNTVVADTPVHYGSALGTLYSPRNYEDRFSGPVMLGDALGKSLNVPAIRTAQRVGVPNLLKVLRNAGFTSLKRDAGHYGLGLTLGNGEVTLLELTQAYAMLGRGGMSCEAHFDASKSSHTHRVLSGPVVALTSHILRNERLRIEAFGPNNALVLGYPVAIKTGTSSDWRDNWAVGYTDTHTIGVWIGDTTGRPMQGLAGVAGAGPLFRRVLESLPPTTPELLAPSHQRPLIVTAPVCAVSGRRPSPSCSHIRQTPIRTASYQQLASCDWHKTVAIDGRNNLLAGPQCDEHVTHHKVVTQLPPVYAGWEAARGHAPPPSSYSPLCPAKDEHPSHARITFPRVDERFALDPGLPRATQRIQLTAQVDDAVQEVTWIINGEPVGKAQWPYGLTWELSPGTHRVQVAAAGVHSPEIRFQVL
jgi:penicillin-binding protein 1C